MEEVGCVDFVFKGEVYFRIHPREKAPYWKMNTDIHPGTFANLLIQALFRDEKLKTTKLIINRHDNKPIIEISPEGVLPKLVTLSSFEEKVFQFLWERYFATQKFELPLAFPGASKSLCVKEI